MKWTCNCAGNGAVIHSRARVSLEHCLLFLLVCGLMLLWSFDSVGEDEQCIVVGHRRKRDRKEKTKAREHEGKSVGERKRDPQRATEPEQPTSWRPHDTTGGVRRRRRTVTSLARGRWLHSRARHFLHDTTVATTQRAPQKSEINVRRVSRLRCCSCPQKKKKASKK